MQKFQILYHRTTLFKQLSFFCLTLFMIMASVFTVSAQEPGQSEKAAVSAESSQWQVLATSPGVKVIIENQGSPGFVLKNSENPLDAASNWLTSKGLQQGRMIKNDKLLYISVGAATIMAKPDEEEFIDSRYLAFQRAELDAKAKLAMTLGVDLSTERGSANLRTSPKERQALKELYSSSKALQNSAEKAGIADRIKSIFDKATRLAETKLDNALEEAEATPEKNKADNNILKSININDTSLKASAAAYTEVQGAQVIQTFEGSYRDSYMVVVVTLWSQNIQKLVDSMISGQNPAQLDPVTAKKEIIKQLPTNPDELMCLTGVRAYINERGERTLLAFGQAGVMDTGEEAMDYMDAHEAAGLRALSALRTFMGETVLKNSTTEVYEALARYVYKDGKRKREYGLVNELESKIQAKATEQKITGIQSVYSKEISHSFTGRPLVLEVYAWSPGSQAMAKDIKAKIENKSMPTVESEVRNHIQKKPATAKKGLKSSGAGADSDAW